MTPLLPVRVTIFSLPVLGLIETLLKLGCTMHLTRMPWLHGQMHAPTDADLQTRLKPHINKISNIVFCLYFFIFCSGLYTILMAITYNSRMYKH